MISSREEDRSGLAKRGREERGEGIPEVGLPLWEGVGRLDVVAEVEEEGGKWRGGESVREGVESVEDPVEGA